MIQPMARATCTNDALQLIGLHPNHFIASLVAPNTKTFASLERKTKKNRNDSRNLQIYPIPSHDPSPKWIENGARIRSISLTTAVFTQRKMYPSSCNDGIFSCLISSSAIVPYGNSIWISHGGSAIITENLPRTDMSNCRRSHCTHWDGNEPGLMRSTMGRWRLLFVAECVSFDRGTKSVLSIW